VNNLVNIILLKTYITRLLFIVFFINSFSITAQGIELANAKKYTIEDITISGSTNFSSQTIITYSGLRKGQEVFIPGEKISAAIKKLWSSNLFSSIDIFMTKAEGDNIVLEIALVDLPELKEAKIEGVKKSKIEEIKKENTLQPGVKVTENLITTTKNYLQDKYKKKGYYNANVTIITTKVIDTVQKNKVNMLVSINKGNKIKVKDIVFNGAEKLKSKKLRKVMKNTKKKNPIRVYKRSKYVEEDFKEDLISVINKYKENGYRDARIISDSIIKNDDGTISLKITLEEGEKYTYGNIIFLGNTVYTDQQLNQILRINKGDTYNGVELSKRIEDNSKPDANDLTNLYQDSGYLFSTITPIEVSADGNVIDMEIRIIEGKPAYFNKVTVTGNDKTNDHVIYRELRVRPGQLYRKRDVVRTVRELGQLGFFDAQQIEPNFKM